MADVLSLVAESYEDLPIFMIEFFSVSSGGAPGAGKTLGDCLRDYEKSKNRDGKFISPGLILPVCKTLVANGYLHEIDKRGPLAMNNVYSATSIAETARSTDRDNLAETMSCLAFGFPYMVGLMKDRVFPIVNRNFENDLSIGTGFLFENSIITAKHCLESSKKVSIKGFSKESLSNAKVYFHPDLDIARVDFVELLKKDSFKRSSEPNILDPVVAMGYPRIPGFYSFLTAESGQISARITSTRGTLAAKALSYFYQKELYLITARIRGGNSGGPVIESSGALVGVAVQQPIGEGKMQDDLGYGTVIPFRYIRRDLFDNNIGTDVSKKLTFEEFEDS